MQNNLVFIASDVLPVSNFCKYYRQVINLKQNYADTLVHFFVPVYFAFRLRASLRWYAMLCMRAWRALWASRLE